jgi:hypothetical protein
MLEIWAVSEAGRHTFRDVSAEASNHKFGFDLEKVEFVKKIPLAPNLRP